MYYFSYISNSYSCKNSLEKAVYQKLLAVNRRVIPFDQLETVKADILTEIKACNEAHPRCKPIHNPHWWQVYDGKDFLLQIGGGICNFYLYSSKP